MKKALCAVLSVILIISLSVTAFAWSVPWDITSDDDATLFFGEVVSFYPKKNSATVAANKIIKGDIRKGGLVLVEGIYDTLIPGNTYIFASFNKGFGETYVFYPDSYDTETLTLSDRDDPDNNVERMINDGTYKAADDRRIDKINNTLRTNEKALSLADVLNLSEDDIKTVTIDFEYQTSYTEFFNTCKEITAYPVQKDTKSPLRIMTFSVGDNVYHITSDAKIISDKHSYYAEYTVSAADRDRLTAFLPEDSENLPAIHNGTLIIGVTAILIFALFAAGSALIILFKNKKKHIDK